MSKFAAMCWQDIRQCTCYEYIADLEFYYVIRRAHIIHEKTKSMIIKGSYTKLCFSNLINMGKIEKAYEIKSKFKKNCFDIMQIHNNFINSLRDIKSNIIYVVRRRYGNNVADIILMYLFNKHEEKKSAVKRLIK